MFRSLCLKPSNFCMINFIFDLTWTGDDIIIVLIGCSVCVRFIYMCIFGSDWVSEDCV